MDESVGVKKSRKLKLRNGRGCERITEAEFRNNKRRNISEEPKVVKSKKVKVDESIERISEIEFRGKISRKVSGEPEVVKTNKGKGKESSVEPISKAEFSTIVKDPGFRNRDISQEHQSKSRAECSKRQRISTAKRGRDYQQDESEDSDQINIKELFSARSHIRKGKQPNKRKSNHKVQKNSSRRPSKVIENYPDSTSSECADDSDDSLYELEKLEPSLGSTSSSESDEKDDVPAENFEKDHNRSEHLMEFSDSNNLYQESVQENKELPDVQESATKRVNVEINSEEHPKKTKKVVSSTSIETGKSVEKQREKSVDKDGENAKLCMDEAARKGKKKVDVEEDNSSTPTKEVNAELKETTKLCMDEAARKGKKKVDVQEDNSSTATKEVNVELKETKQPTKRDVRIQTGDPFCKRLLDSLLSENNQEEIQEKNHEEPNVQSINRLPLKFRFEDEIPKPVEKSEYEKMIDSLFDKMDSCMTTQEETDPSSCQEVDKDKHVEDCSSPNDNVTDQLAKCRKGNHCFIEDDELGIMCQHCLHVEVEARYILPAWAEKTNPRVKKLRISSNTEKPDLNDVLYFTPGEREIPAAASNSNHGGNGTIWDYLEPSVKISMHEHQLEGFEFLWRNIAGTTQLSEIATSQGGGCIISHAPGTGKTRLTIEFIKTYLRRFPDCRPLIIAPASMLLTWEGEFKRWNTEFKFHNLNSPEFADGELRRDFPYHIKKPNKQQMRTLKLVRWIKGKSILGLSYDLFVRFVGDKTKEPIDRSMRTILLEKPGLVVLDEGHIPRNQGSNNWKAISMLKPTKRIILSGTPFQNNFEELFNVIQVVRPSIVEEERFKRFKEVLASKRSHSKSIVVEKNIDEGIKELKTAIAPFVHVHKGSILLQQLPGLMDCVVLLKPLPLQKSLIEKIERSQNTFTDDSKVALISTHPSLFIKCELTEKEKSGVDEAVLEESRLNPDEGVKTRFVMELVRICISRKEKVLIFSQYVEPLILMKQHLEKTFSWAEEKHILMIKGGVEQKNRQNFIESFNNPNSEAKVLLASTRCCSEGISLVGASRVVLLDVVWNHAVERQAISRAYRLRQTKVVYTYHLMAMGTKEQDKFQQQARKGLISEKVFTSSSNEKCKGKDLDAGIIDDVLELIRADENFKDLFDKVIYEPMEKNLIESFGQEDLPKN